ncbi:FAD-binding oxidoreductase [Actinomadura soli]|uniref:FAD-binding oxidoreductase n=1 Tax=Actinomadura soli TaxID=2508997 RepID=A0A5C4J894_9ACTN|nr:FAD-binding protein [Actinomadura soli]TMQ94560.1 FAD-binding oxidoreductase [Actinomadura soli]
MADAAVADEGGLKIMPGDRRFAALCRGFNPRWRANPEYVRVVRTSEETRAALEKAVNEQVTGTRDRITVRSGGHCYEDFVCSDDVRVIIDVSLMDRIYEDPDRGEDVVCVEAGATNGDLRKGLFLQTGRVLPGGSCPSVGVGGHVPVGGFGLLSRQFGLTVDYLYAVEVAVVDEDRRVRLVVATDEPRDPNRDLWWAHTGGGGGNFGIVTRFWFRALPQVPERVLLTASGWKWSQMNRAHFGRIIDNFGEFFATTDPAAQQRYRPLFAILLLSHRSQDKIGLIAQIDASVPDAEARLKEFLRAMSQEVGPVRESLSEAYGEYPALAGLESPAMLPWSTVDKLLGPVDNLRCGKHKSAYMREPLPREQIDELWAALALEDPDIVRDAVIQIDSYGGEINDRSPMDTAVIQRSSVLKLQHQIYWPAGQDGDDHLRWIRELYQRMYQGTGGVPVPDGHQGQHTTDGCYIGYPDVDLSDPRWNTSTVPWSELYYGRHYGKLQDVKLRWDPLDIFRHRQSVQLPIEPLQPG